MKLKPWREKRWCIPRSTPSTWRAVLALYAEAPTPRRPVVASETPRQLIGDARVPIRAEPGKPRRVDYEYVRNGTANVFLFVDVHRPWRHAKVTDHRTCVDFAECMRDLVDEHYPEAERIQVVLDNLSTHSAAALYQTFAPAEARRILKRLEFHYTPKHASWLGRDRDRGDGPAMPIPDKATLVLPRSLPGSSRNAEQAGINRLFTVDRARTKMGRVYPQPARRAKAAA